MAGMKIRNTIPMVGCFTLAAVLHGFWLSVSLESPPQTSRPHPTRVTAYFEELPGGWSPTLFSLPSPTGFSGAMKENRLRTAPPLQSPLTLTEDIRVPVPKFSLRPEAVLEMPRDVEGYVIPPYTVPGKTASAVERWSLVFPEDPRLEARLSRLPQERPEILPYTISGEMAFDASGRLASLLVDPSSQEDPADISIIRTLRRVRAPLAPPGRWIRFSFTYSNTGAEK